MLPLDLVPNLHPRGETLSVLDRRTPSGHVVLEVRLEKVILRKIQPLTPQAYLPFSDLLSAGLHPCDLSSLKYTAYKGQTHMLTNTQLQKGDRPKAKILIYMKGIQTDQSRELSSMSCHLF